MLRRRREPDPVPPGRELLPGNPVVSLLSHGRRVDTYDVHSLERDCRCVIKRLRPDRSHDRRVREAVLLEGTLLRDLTHPHLVRAYDVVEEPLPAMVLETLGGTTLAALTETEPLDTADAAELGLQLASALAYLHRQGGLHLDVKPANIVVESRRATLIDLSLAGRPGTGRPGAGTRGYLAPEQARGHNLSTATDVWGLGVTLAESLTGDLSHGDEATWDTKRRIPLLRRRRPHPPQLSGLPDHMAALLTDCLQLDPSQRPSLPQVRTRLTQIARSPDHQRPTAGPVDDQLDLASSP